MSIVNEPKLKNGLLCSIREQLEHRALWMYLLCDEAKKKGLNPEEYAPEAIKRCGLYQGANLRKKAGRRLPFHREVSTPKRRAWASTLPQNLPLTVTIAVPTWACPISR